MRDVVLLLALLLLGPAETLAGKFPIHAPEYLERYPPAPVPLPDPLPGDVPALCALVQAGHATPQVYAALGEALLAGGEAALAYRAFHAAQVRGDEAWGRRMQQRKEATGARVDPGEIEEEQAHARFWVARLQEYERDRIARGEDPRDLGAFHDRYGRPEDDLPALARARRITWAVSAALVLMAAGGLLLFLRRRRA
jgi:hypothetical protein